MRVLVAAVLLSLTLAGCAGAPTGSTEATMDVPTDQNGDGIVVVAVIDGGFNPYHLDMVGTMMPQHLDADPGNDLPLDRPPHEWIPGFPDPSTFASYNEVGLDLSYAADPHNIDESLDSQDLHDADKNIWRKAQSGSTLADTHYNYFPGTKVIGMVNTGGGDGFAASSHGVGTSTVSVGNIHGSCPDCLLVFVNNGGGETASDWVLQQDWIDVQTNSFGYSAVARDRMYAGSDIEAQKEAVSNGQAIFFSAGNGQGNSFTVPNPTLFSSQEGPDWIVTVGAIDPVGYDSYQGHGKPADIASIGSGYPSGGYCDDTINCTGEFGGTSNATPVTAGTYAKALLELRRQATMARDPESEFIVNGVPAGQAVYGALGADVVDGRTNQTLVNFTTPMLLDAMFLAAEHHSSGWVAGITGVPYPVQTTEMQFMSEGHGSFIGRLHGDADWNGEWQAIVDAALEGAGDMKEGEEDWFINDSYCRQSIWGTWAHGDYTGDNLPGPDPLWPVRTALQQACPTVVKAVVDAEQTVGL